jgi:hypothetical protein
MCTKRLARPLVSTSSGKQTHRRNELADCILPLRPIEHPFVLGGKGHRTNCPSGVVGRRLIGCDWMRLDAIGCGLSGRSLDFETLELATRRSECEERGIARALDRAVELSLADVSNVACYKQKHPDSIKAGVMSRYQKKIRNNASRMLWKKCVPSQSHSKQSELRRAFEKSVICLILP